MPDGTARGMKEMNTHTHTHTHTGHKIKKIKSVECMLRTCIKKIVIEDLDN